MMVLLAGIVWPGCELMQSDQGAAFEEIEQIPAGKALVFVYRPSADLAWAEVYEVKVNGRVVSQLSDGGYFPHFANAGKLAFAVEGVGTDTARARLGVHSGKTYYVKVRPVRDTSESLAGSPQPRVGQVRPEVAEIEIIQCSLMLKE